MKNLTADELRDAYLKFFESKGHKIIPGASVIPENDPTVLFTTAGMHPLVPYLMGAMEHPAGTRLTDLADAILDRIVHDGYDINITPIDPKNDIGLQLSPQTQKVTGKPVSI